MKLNLTTIISAIFIGSMFGEGVETFEVLENDILEQKVLAAGKKYLIPNNLAVEAGASLIIQEGVEISLEPNVSVVVRGNFIAKGSADRPIIILGSKPAEPAEGLVFEGSLAEKNKVELSFVRLRSLLNPVHFKRGWNFEEIVLNNNNFSGFQSNCNIVHIGQPGEINTDYPVLIDIVENDFIGNSGRVYFEGTTFRSVSFNVVRNNFFYNYLISSFDNFRNSFVAIKNTAGLDLNLSGNIFSSNFVLCSSSSDLVVRSIGVARGAASTSVTRNQVFSANKPFLKNSFYDFKTDRSAPPTSLESKGDFQNGKNQFYDLTPSLSSENETVLKMTDDLIEAHITLDKSYQELHREGPSYINISVLAIDSIGWTVKKNFSGWGTVRSKELENKIILSLKVDSVGPLSDSIVESTVCWQKDEDGNTRAWGVGLDKFLRKYREALDEQTEMPFTRRNGQGYTGNEHRLGKSRFPIKYRDPKWSLGLSILGSTYFGDLTEQDLEQYGALSQYNLGFGVSLRRRIWVQGLSLELDVNYLRIEGADAQHDQQIFKDRNLAFTSDLFESNLLVKYALFQSESPGGWNLQVGAGIGWVFFNPKRKVNGITYELRDFGTGGQLINGGQPYSRSAATITPAKLELSRRLSKRFQMSFNLAWRMAMTDYLDDVGGDLYPDPESIAAANGSNPDIARYLSDPSNGLFSSKQGSRRGNPDTTMDVYFTTGFTLIYVLTQ